MLESKLETALLQNQKLTESLAESEASHAQARQELAKKSSENARLVTSLNEARAQLNFADKKAEGIGQEF